MARADITIKEQFERRKNWKNAFVDAVVSTFLVREAAEPKDFGVLDLYEFLVTKRIKGAEQGQFQVHHGGFLDVTDVDIYDGGAREASEETGYALDADSDLVYLASVGPAIYRSELAIVDMDSVLLTISEVEAEPTVGFALPLFIADVTGREPGETDGEVGSPTWMTARQIIEQFATDRNAEGHSKFNYYQFLVIALLHLSGRWQSGKRAVSAPGSYQFDLDS